MSIRGVVGSNLSAYDWYSLSDRVVGCRSRKTGTGSPSLIDIGNEVSMGSGGGGGGDGTRGVDAFFF